MRRIRFAVFVSLSLSVCGGCLAADFEVDGLEYTILSAASVSVSGADKAKTGVVVIPDEVINGSAAYSVVSIDERAFEDCSAITSISIPHSVTTVGNDAFSFCASLREVVLADSSVPLAMGYILNLNAGLFADSAVEKVYLGRDLSYNVRRGHSPFSGRKTLTTLIIGEQVTEIGGYAFSGCSSLSAIMLLTPDPPIVADNAFDGVGKRKCVLTVPAGSLDAYKAAPGWAAFENITDGSSSVSSPSAAGLLRYSVSGGILRLFNLPAGSSVSLFRPDGTICRLMRSDAECELPLPGGVYILVVCSSAKTDVLKIII